MHCVHNCSSGIYRAARAPFLHGEGILARCTGARTPAPRDCKQEARCVGVAARGAGRGARGVCPRALVPACLSRPRPHGHVTDMSQTCHSALAACRFSRPLTDRANCRCAGHVPARAARAARPRPGRRGSGPEPRLLSARAPARK